MALCSLSYNAKEVTIQQQFNIQALYFKSLDNVLELSKELEIQGNVDLCFRVSTMIDNIKPEQKPHYKKKVLKPFFVIFVNTFSSNNAFHQLFEDCLLFLCITHLFYTACNLRLGTCKGSLFVRTLTHA